MRDIQPHKDSARGENVMIIVTPSSLPVDGGEDRVIHEYPVLASDGTSILPLAIVDHEMAPNTFRSLVEKTDATFSANGWLGVIGNNESDVMVIVMMSHGYVCRVWVYDKCSHEYTSTPATIYSNDISQCR
jgi:hypothetical protein